MKLLSILTVILWLCYTTHVVNAERVSELQRRAAEVLRLLSVLRDDGSLVQREAGHPFDWIPPAALHDGKNEASPSALHDDSDRALPPFGLHDESTPDKRKVSPFALHDEADVVPFALHDEEEKMTSKKGERYPYESDLYPPRGLHGADESNEDDAAPMALHDAPMALHDSQTGDSSARSDLAAMKKKRALDELEESDQPMALHRKRSEGWLSRRATGDHVTSHAADDWFSKSDDAEMRERREAAMKWKLADFIQKRLAVARRRHMDR